MATSSAFVYHKTSLDEFSSFLSRKFDQLSSSMSCLSHDMSIGGGSKKMVNEDAHLTSTLQTIQKEMAKSPCVEQLTELVLEKFPQGNLASSLAMKFEQSMLAFYENYQKPLRSLLKLKPDVEELHKVLKSVSLKAAEGVVIIKGVKPDVKPSLPSRQSDVKLDVTLTHDGGINLLKSASLKAAEGEVNIEDVKPTRQSDVKLDVTLTRDGGINVNVEEGLTLTVEEGLNATLTRDGGITSFDLQGILSLHLLGQEDEVVQFQFQIETHENPEIHFSTNPNFNRDIFDKKKILSLKRPDQPFCIGQGGDGVGLLRWRMQQADVVPLTINCWPSVSRKKSYVSLEYVAPDMFDLTNVIISVPLPALRDAPSITQCDGDSRYDLSKSVLEWSILLIDSSNRSGSMEFVVPQADESVFFPISLQFEATTTYSGLKVTGMIPLRGGTTPRFVQRTQLIAQNYQVL